MLGYKDLIDKTEAIHAQEIANATEKRAKNLKCIEMIKFLSNKKRQDGKALFDPQADTDIVLTLLNMIKGLELKMVVYDELLEACENTARGQLQHPTLQSYVNHSIAVCKTAIDKAKGN